MNGSHGTHNGNIYVAPAHGYSGHGSAHAAAPTSAHFVRVPSSEIKANSLVEKVATRDGKGSWQHKVIKNMLKESFQMFLVFLLIVDVLCVVTELFLEARYPSCYRARQAVEQCSFNLDGTPAMGGGHRAEDVHAGSVDHGIMSYEPVCKHHPGYLDRTHTGLRWTSITILFLFVFELLLMLAALRALFFTSIVYIIDIVVVVTSLTLDFVLLTHSDDLHSDEAAQFATLLVVARLWRFIRVGHGIFTATYETVELQSEEERTHLLTTIHKLKNQVAQLEAERGFQSHQQPTALPPPLQVPVYPPTPQYPSSRMAGGGPIVYYDVPRPIMYGDYGVGEA